MIPADILSNNYLYLSGLGIGYGQKCGASFHRPVDFCFGLRDKGQGAWGHIIFALGWDTR